MRYLIGSAAAATVGKSGENPWRAASVANAS